MKRTIHLLLIGLGLLGLFGFGMAQGDDEITIFTVISEVPKDKARIAVKASVDGVVSDMKLLPTETIQNNLIWKKLEICHAMKLEGMKVADGFRVTSVRVVDASMLPMTLQSFAGDCLIKKAVEIAPLVD